MKTESEKMKIYGLKNCDTCRKALKSIPDSELCDVRAQGISPELLKAAFAQFGTALMNTRSTTWRGLDDESRAGDPLELITAHPSLMKRPLIVANNQMYLGWTKEVQDALGI